MYTIPACLPLSIPLLPPDTRPGVSQHRRVAAVSRRCVLRAARVLVPSHMSLLPPGFSIARHVASPSPAGTAETAKLVQKWATPKSGALSSAEAQARAVTAQGVDEIALQVGLEG